MKRGMLVASLIVFVVVLVVVSVSVGWLNVADPVDSLVAEVESFDEPYRSLGMQCLSMEYDSGCCLASVRTMASYGYVESKGGVYMKDKVCPEGFQINFFRCMGSLAWCMPDSKQ